MSGYEKYIFNSDAFFKDLDKRFENEELIYDFKIFLNYILSRKVKLTPKNLWIPAKHIYAINSLFRYPVQLDEKLGDKIYKLREEIGYSRFYFLDLLAGASGCLVIDEKNILVKGENYDEFIKMGGLNKKLWLVLSWWFGMDWEYWMQEGDFGELMQKRKFLMADYLRSWLDKRGKIDFKKICKELRTGLNLKWEAPSQDYAKELQNWGIERCLLLPMVYFDIIKLVRKKDKYNIDKTVGFYIQPIGKIFIKEIIYHLEKRAVRWS